MSARLDRARPGMSLVEMMVAMTILVLVIAGALSALQTQTLAFRIGTERMDLLQNFRYAANVLEKDLRTVGSGVPANQPFLIYAGADVIAFNADFVTNLPNDVFAVYSDTSAPTAQVTSLPVTRRIQIPRTALWYPDATYMVGVEPSRAETIIFFFTPDATTARADDYVLMRQNNDAAPEVVARDLLEPFFEYFQIVDPGTQTASLGPVPAADIPLHHSITFHGAPADTGSVARIDAVRAVRVSFTATNGLTGAEERTSVISRMIRLPNAGKAVLQTCGDAPYMGVPLTAEADTGASGEPEVTLTWDPAIDETAGEQDAIRYVIWRRPASSADWGEPLLSIPAGLPSYTYVDPEVAPGESYYYGVAVQDCTPSLSDLAVAGPVFVNP